MEEPHGNLDFPHKEFSETWVSNPQRINCTGSEPSYKSLRFLSLLIVAFRDFYNKYRSQLLSVTGCPM